MDVMTPDLSRTLKALVRLMVQVLVRLASSALTQTEGSGSLLSLPIMTLAGLVQTNGLGSPLCSRM